MGKLHNISTSVSFTSAENKMHYCMLTLSAKQQTIMKNTRSTSTIS